MIRVYHRTRVNRSNFRNLPFGAVYWLASNTATAPSIKIARAAKAGALDTTTDSITQTAISDTRVEVVVVPQVFLKPTA